MVWCLLGSKDAGFAYDYNGRSLAGMFSFFGYDIWKVTWQATIALYLSKTEYGCDWTYG